MPYDWKKVKMAALSVQTMMDLISKGDLSGLIVMLDRDVNIDERDENGQTVLIVASQKGNIEIVSELIDRGADVNAEDLDNWSALLNAAKEGHIGVVRLLLNNGAKLEQRDVGGWTPLMWACYKGQTEVAIELLEKGANCNVIGEHSVSPLIWASGRGHTEIVEHLLQKGAKPNTADKYGTTALVWACRKGHATIVEALLEAGANVDTAGMNSWTPLIIATKGNFPDVISLLLEKHPNVNAIDKDGCTALIIAAKEGYTEIAIALLNVGAYVNLHDRNGDTVLVNAVKGGYVQIVQAILKKYADVDAQGSESKTALYWAVEKGYEDIVRVILEFNPDTEIATKDGDTPLLRATRNKNAEIVQMLLENKARVSAADKKGDTALHIAIRARNKRIVEILLRNPKNSRLLYRPNRAGETPYNIDAKQFKSILTQIFGTRRLNTSEDNENMLGYDLYSSTLADMLSEPSLCMPITVGLFAKWGSGKSFLLGKLQDEMRSFAHQWTEPTFQFSWLVFCLVLAISSLIALVVGLTTVWEVAIGVGIGLLVMFYAFLGLLWYGGYKHDWHTIYDMSIFVGKKMISLDLLLKIIFCIPPNMQGRDIQGLPTRFLFTDYTRLSTVGGEKSLAGMIGTLSEALEKEYGTIPTRIYRVFKVEPVTSASWRWKRICCIPYFLIVFLLVILAIVGIIMLCSNSFDKNDTLIKGLLITIATILGIVIIGTSFKWIHILIALCWSQKRRILNASANIETLKMEGFMQILKSEVDIMAHKVKCIDAFLQIQTRLVVIVDGLDSCEQEKVLQVLDIVKLLFSDVNAPFITILAIDPHIIIKAIQENLHRVFHDTNINGHDYLRTIVHLPFYLQNTAIRRVPVSNGIGHRGQGVSEESLIKGKITRQDSSFSTISLPDSVPTGKKMKNSLRLKHSESVHGSSTNLSRPSLGFDLSKVLVTDDYFSDINPRSMRRLMNIIYISARLLKAFHVEFNWYRLAAWINITEQWPYRTSWLILYYEQHDEIDDNTTLKTIYDTLFELIPTSKEVEPLLEIDRNERKFETFLSFHKPALCIADLKLFLPFTINLDPYLRKIIKEEQQNIDDALRFEMTRNLLTPHPISTASSWDPLQPIPAQPTQEHKGLFHRRSASQRLPSHLYSGVHSMPASISSVSGRRPSPLLWSSLNQPSQTQQYYQNPYQIRNFNRMYFKPITAQENLSSLTVDGVMDLLRNQDGIEPTMLETYYLSLKENNINGKVLLHCDLDELKKVLKMSFGDWELFRVMILTLRDQEYNTSLTSSANELDNGHSGIDREQMISSSHVRFMTPNTNIDKTYVENASEIESVYVKVPSDRPFNQKRHSKEHRENKAHSSSIKRQNTYEKQIEIENQWLCGALRSLSEEAMEDALGEDMRGADGEDGILMFSASQRLATIPDVTEEDTEQSSSLEVKEILLGSFDYQEQSGITTVNDSMQSSRSSIADVEAGLTANSSNTENFDAHSDRKPLILNDAITKEKHKKQNSILPSSNSDSLKSVKEKLAWLASEDTVVDTSQDIPLVRQMNSEEINFSPFKDNSNLSHNNNNSAFTDINHIKERPLSLIQAFESETASSSAKSHSLSELSNIEDDKLSTHQTLKEQKSAPIKLHNRYTVELVPDPPENKNEISDMETIL